MALSRSEMDRRIDEHFGYEARDDVAGVLATLAEDVEPDGMIWRENVRVDLAAIMAQLPS